MSPFERRNERTDVSAAVVDDNELCLSHANWFVKRLRGAFAAAAATAAFLLLPLHASIAAQTPAGLNVPDGFSIESIAHVDGPRELAIAANGDLFVGTNGNSVVVVAGAQASPSAPVTFVRIKDRPVAGIAIAGDALYIGGQFGVYRLPFAAGDRTARGAPRKLANLRPSGIARDHVTTTVAIQGKTIYASVGSSCNNCQPDLDATRATIEQMQLDGSGLTPRAEHIRNAIALAVNAATGSLWAGVAGQDELAHGHPFEIIDDISAHAGVADFGWPYCYENQKAVSTAHDCSHAALPRVVVPAYETPIGAAFYLPPPGARYALPPAYRGGLFVTLHGSWHSPPVAPRVVFIPMRGDEPQIALNWTDPDAQWHEFVGGFQQPDGSRIGRPTGIAVGTDGSIFVADDGSGAIYRIRPRHA